MLCLGVPEGIGEASLALAPSRVHDWSVDDRRGDPGELPVGMLSGLEFGLVMTVSPGKAGVQLLKERKDGGWVMNWAYRRRICQNAPRVSGLYSGRPTGDCGPRAAK